MTQITPEQAQERAKPDVDRVIAIVARILAMHGGIDPQLAKALAEEIAGCQARLALLSIAADVKLPSS